MSFGQSFLILIYSKHCEHKSHTNPLNIDSKSCNAHMKMKPVLLTRKQKQPSSFTLVVEHFTCLRKISLLTY